MEKSETIGKLTLALSKVQAQLKPAKENSKNPFFKSNYAEFGIQFVAYYLRTN